MTVGFAFGVAIGFFLYKYIQEERAERRAEREEETRRYIQMCKRSLKAMWDPQKARREEKERRKKEEEERQKREEEYYQYCAMADAYKKNLISDLERFMMRTPEEDLSVLDESVLDEKHKQLRNEIQTNYMLQDMKWKMASQIEEERRNGWHIGIKVHMFDEEE